jgi:endonuclease YncB( thermonuclease family)
MTRVVVAGVILLAALVAVARDVIILRGVVVGVADGDTLTILDAERRQHRIRLAGIDAPERSQAFGRRSQQSLRDLAHGRVAEVQVTKVDRYGRLVGKVVVDERDLCREQLRLGFAWFYADYQNELSPSDRTSYSAAQRDARQAGIGLWADPHPVPPWVFRRRR